MTAELLGILKYLGEAGIKAVPMKGPQLAQQFYGDIELRQFSDLDVLVSPTDAEKALEIVQSRGYILAHNISSAKRQLLMKTMHHHHLHNLHSGIILELHWTVAPKCYGLSMDVPFILGRAELADLMGQKILWLSTADSMILISQHGAKHLWERLSWICDMAALVHSDRTALYHANQRMKAAGEERILLLGLVLAEDLLGADLPQDFGISARGDRALVDISRQIMQELILEINSLKDCSKRQIDQSILFMNLYNRPSQKVSYILRMISDPIDVDMDAIELPERALSLYRLVKMSRIMSTYSRAFCEWLQRSIKD
jgi:hypothetical protein